MSAMIHYTTIMVKVKADRDTVDNLVKESKLHEKVEEIQTYIEESLNSLDSDFEFEVEEE